MNSPLLLTYIDNKKLVSDSSHWLEQIEVLEQSVFTNATQTTKQYSRLFSHNNRRTDRLRSLSIKQDEISSLYVKLVRDEKFDHLIALKYQRIIREKANFVPNTSRAIENAAKGEQGSDFSRKTLSFFVAFCTLIVTASLTASESLISGSPRTAEIAVITLAIGLVSGLGWLWSADIEQRQRAKPV